MNSLANLAARARSLFVSATGFDEINHPRDNHGRWVKKYAARWGMTKERGRQNFLIDPNPSAEGMTADDRNKYGVASRIVGFNSKFIKPVEHGLMSRIRTAFEAQLREDAKGGTLGYVTISRVLQRMGEDVNPQSVVEQLEHERLSTPERDKAKMAIDRMGSLTSFKLKPTLPAEKPKLQTDTPEFKAWFGDSKVVDKDGKPLVVYHGTKGDFSTFDEKKGGANFEDWEYHTAEGFHFSSRPDEADEYATGAKGEGGENIAPVYLQMKNPLVINVRKFKSPTYVGEKTNNPADYLDTHPHLITNAKYAEHDGLILNGGYNDKPTTHYVVFHPTQIKSIFNRGTWNPKDPSISASDCSPIFPRHASMSEGGMNRLCRNAETISNLLQCESFRLHGFGGLDAPSQREVLHCVDSFGCDREILKAVVGFVPVNVVNILAEKQLSANALFCNKAVLQDLLSADSNGLVATAVDVANSLVGAVTGVAAKVLGVMMVDASAGSEKYVSATGTNKFVSFHADNLPNQADAVKLIGNKGTWSTTNPDITASLAVRAANILKASFEGHAGRPGKVGGSAPNFAKQFEANRKARRAIQKQSEIDWLKENQPRTFEAAEAYIKKANDKFQAFDAMLAEVAEESASGEYKANMKSAKSLAMKVIRHVDPNYGFSAPKDHVRGVIFLDDWSQVEAVTDSLAARGKFKGESHLLNGYNKFGYRSLMISTSLGDGINGEIQLHTQSSWALKRHTDEIYAEFRKYDKTDITALSMELKKAIKAGQEKSTRLWDNYWAGVPPAVKEAASASVIGLESRHSPSVPLKVAQAPFSNTRMFSPLAIGASSRILPSGNRENLEAFIAANLPPNLRNVKLIKLVNREARIVECQNSDNLILAASSPKCGCLMAMLPSFETGIPNWAADNISADTLVEDGIETETHATVLYGFNLDFASLKLKKFLFNQGPIKGKLGKLSRFECPEYDVIKFSIESPELVALNKKLADEFADEITPSEWSYKPHVTVAYVKKGTNQNLNASQFEGQEFTVNQLLYSLPEKKGRIVISLFGTGQRLSASDASIQESILASDQTGHKFRGNQWVKIASLAKIQKGIHPTSTEQFKAWFGKSKLLDSTGKPLVLYHGTHAKFSEFSPHYMRQTDDGYYGTGFYFTPSAEGATEYGHNVMPVYVKLEKPFEIVADGAAASDTLFDLRDKLASLPDMPEGLKTNRTLPEGYEIRRRELEDGTYGYMHGQNNTRFEVVPQEKFYGTDKEIYGEEMMSPLAATISFNDDQSGHKGDFDDWWAFGLLKSIGRDKFQTSLKKAGYDGVTIKSPGETLPDEVLAFYPTQIKSIHNAGTWNPADLKITARNAGDEARDYHGRWTNSGFGAPQLKPNHEKNRTTILDRSPFKLEPTRESGTRFFEAISSAAAAHAEGKAVTIQDKSFYESPELEKYLTPDGRAGAAIAPDGELISVFKAPGTPSGEVRTILAQAARHAKYLMCFDTRNFLPALYSQYGFKPAAAVSFNDQYAPKGWDYKKNNHPHVLFMVRDPEGASDLPSANNMELRETVPVYEAKNYEAAHDLALKYVKKINPPNKELVSASDSGQRRAKVGGEYGANGEWYEGGKWISNADNPKSHKETKRATHRQNIEPYKWDVAPLPEHIAIYPTLSGVEKFDHATGKFSLNENLREDYATPEAIAKRKARIEAYNEGERWFHAPLVKIHPDASSTPETVKLEDFGLTKSKGTLGHLGFVSSNDPAVRIAAMVTPGRIFITRLDAVEVGKGHGGKALEKIKKFAEATGRKIELTAGADSLELQDRLNSFYEKHGFKKTDNAKHPSFVWEPTKIISASDQTGHPFHGNQWTGSTKVNPVNPFPVKRGEFMGEFRDEKDNYIGDLHRTGENQYRVRHVEYGKVKGESEIIPANALLKFGGADISSGVHVRYFKLKEKKQLTASSPRASNLAIRAAQVLAKSSQPSEPPASHRQARDAAQAIYEAAAIAAATKAQHEKDKKREDAIAAILLLLLLSGEDAYQKTYSVLDKAESKSTDEIQIGEQAKTFAAGRQPDLKEFAGKLHDALDEAKAQAEADKLTPEETARVLRQTAISKSQVMLDVEPTITLGIIELDRLKRAGFTTCYWSQLDRPTKRHSHTDNENEGVVKIGHRFSSGQRYPGDPCMGVGETAFCLCQLIGVGRE